MNDERATRCGFCGAKTRLPEAHPPPRSLARSRGEFWDTVTKVKTDELGLPAPELAVRMASERGAAAPTPELPYSPPEPLDRIFLVSAILGEPFAVRRPDEVTIGRGLDSTLLFPVKAVSRRHALVKYGESSFIICDLDSTNGTFINGIRVRTSPLADGDQIHIGPFEILVSYERPEPQRGGGLDPSLLQSETRVLGSSPWSFSADLSQITAPEVVQVLELNERTGQLIFELPGRDRGLLVFDRGRIVHAEHRGMIPYDAALALLLEHTGSLHFQARANVDTQRTIHQPNQRLLLEAARVLDEVAQQERQAGSL